MFSTLTTEAKKLVKSHFSVSDVAVEWQIPRELEFGDASTNVALSLARSLKRPPREVAQILAEGLAVVEGVARAEVAGAGYVNLWLTPEFLLKELTKTRQAQTAKVTKKKAAPVIVEYSQPNIAKPLGAHHIIGTVLGQAVANLYRHAGYPVIAWNYLGDWGTQFGKLAIAMQKWGTKPAMEHNLGELLDLYVRFHNEAEKDATLEDQGRAAFRKLEEGDKQLRAFWTDIVTVTKNSLQDLYDRLHVSFDLDYGESFYEDKMQPVLKEGKTKKVFKEGKEGALIVEFPEAKNMPPYLVLKGDGATLYSTRDLAQMRYRIDTYHPQLILIFTDIAQKLHFEQLVQTCKQLEWELPAFENVLFGRMRFADKSMSTRKGNILKLEEVLDEAVDRATDIIKERGDSIQADDPSELAEMMGVGAIVYGILSQNRKMDIVFDWNKMLSFEGNSAPYLQYTHARARSVLRKGEEAGAKPADAVVDTLAASERQLLRTLLLFPSVLEDARINHMPHKLANYLYQLCQDYNAFYNNEPIVKAAEPQRGFRLHLTELTAGVLKSGAELLTLRVPERM